MNNSDRNHTLEQLQQLGLLDKNAINMIVNDDGTGKNDSNDTPWFIHLFFGFSGILSSIFFVGFLTLLLFEADVFENTSLQLATGVVLSGAGWLLFKNKHTRRSTFWNSLAFALSAAGQLYVVFALFGNEIVDTPLDTWLLLLIQTVMTLIMPNLIYRLLSASVALGCAVYLLSYYQLPEISLGILALITIVANLQRHSLLQLVPVKWRAGAFDISKAFTYASTFWLIIVSVYIVNAEYNDDFIGNVFTYDYILAQVLLVLASLYAVYLILKRYNIKLLSKSSISIVCSTIILGIISVYAAGLLVTSLIIIIAVANSQRVLLGIGILALVSYIFWYYYQLDTSLLVKSASMLIIGIVMLLMRWLLVSRYFNTAKSISSEDSSIDNQEHLS